MHGWNDDLTDLHEQEAGSDHPIDLASRQDALRKMRAHAPAARSILELGSSAGHMLDLLRASYPDAAIVGSDIIPGALARLQARLPGADIRHLDITANDLPDRSFDAIVALNVLEHIEDDRLAVREVARLLRPGGVFVMEVPAGPGLYDSYDAYLLHYRRYTRAGVRELLRSAGLEVHEQGAIGFALYPAFWISKKIGRLRHGLEPNRERVERSIQTTRSSGLMGAALAFDRVLGRLVSLPVGIRQTAVARRRSD